LVTVKTARNQGFGFQCPPPNSPLLENPTHGFQFKFETDPANTYQHVWPSGILNYRSNDFKYSVRAAAAV